MMNFEDVDVEYDPRLITRWHCLAMSKLHDANRNSKIGKILRRKCSVGKTKALYYFSETRVQVLLSKSLFNDVIVTLKNLDKGESLTLNAFIERLSLYSTQEISEWI